MHRQNIQWEKHIKNYYTKNILKMKEIRDVQYPDDNNQIEYAYEYTHIPYWWQEGILLHAFTHITYPPHVFLEYPSVFTLSIKIFLPLPSSSSHHQGI